MLQKEVRRSPMTSPIPRDPNPEKIPFNNTICKGSLEESFRVQLFSSPQQILARRINKEKLQTIESFKGENYTRQSDK